MGGGRYSGGRKKEGQEERREGERRVKGAGRPAKGMMEMEVGRDNFGMWGKI